MVVNSTVTDISIKGDRRDAYGTYWQAGATMSGNITVPMNRVDFLGLQDIASGVGASVACSGGSTKPLAVSFPYNDAGSVVCTIPVHACVSGVSGIWWAFGKGA